jgi:hypothetical protein
VDATMGEATKLEYFDANGVMTTVRNPMYCGDITGGENVFSNRYGMEDQWRTYTLCRAYCALGFEAVDLTPQLEYFIFYRCRPDGNGELFLNTTALRCKEQKCEYLGPEFGSFMREVKYVEEGVSIRNETIVHDRRRLLFGEIPCCSNAN